MLDANGAANADLGLVVDTSATIIESAGSTSLTQIGSNYFLYGSGGSGPELKYQGANVVAGQFAGWSPIGAEQTATGYDVAWKIATTSGYQYTVWSTTAAATFSHKPAAVSGTSSSVGIA